MIGSIAMDSRGRVATRSAQGISPGMGDRGQPPTRGRRRQSVEIGNRVTIDVVDVGEHVLQFRRFSAEILSFRRELL
jgi:hypothetical protein